MSDTVNSNADVFFAAYKVTLAARVEAHPDQYWGRRGMDLVNSAADRAEYVETAHAKMRVAILADSYNMSPAIQAACRKVGIKPTMGAIKTYIAGGQ